MVNTSPPSTEAPGGVCRPIQMMLLDAQIHELFDALSRYQISQRRVDDQVEILSRITLVDAALRALWCDEEIRHAARAIDEMLEGALWARTRAVGPAPGVGGTDA